MKSDKLDKTIKKFNITYASILIGLFISIAGFIFASSYQQKSTLAQSISNIVEEKLKTNDKRDVLKILSASQTKDFKAIDYYNSQGTRVVAFPDNLSIEHFEQFNFYATIQIPLYFDKEKQHIAGKLLFSINPLEPIVQVALIWLFFAGLSIIFSRYYKQLIIKDFEREGSELRARAITEMTRQIRHDCRGAIQAIRAVTDSSKGLDEVELETLKSVTSRIENMINEVAVSKTQEESSQDALCHVYTSISEIIREKEITHKSKIQFDYEFEALKIFLPINETDLRRIISNILDNSFEAINEKSQEGSVSIKLALLYGKCFIEIHDNGIGIKPELLPQIGKQGVTSKEKGMGRGISWAMDKISKAGGELIIQSECQKWTKVIIEIPFNQNSLLGANEINLDGIDHVVAIDDDPSVIKAWRDKMAPFSINFIGHNSGESYFSSHPPKGKTLYLVDYELGPDPMNGLEIISKIQAQDIYLVTNNFDDSRVQEACIEKKVGIIPKTIIDLIIPSL